MRGISSVAVVAVATFLVYCSADPHPGSDAEGHKTRTLDPLGGGHLVREVRRAQPSNWWPYPPARLHDYSPQWQSDFESLYGVPKRNFDEIDRSDLDNFVKRDMREREPSSYRNMKLLFPRMSIMGSYPGYGVEEPSQYQRFREDHAPTDNLR